jgi:hypothetical protein
MTFSRINDSARFGRRLPAVRAGAALVVAASLLWLSVLAPLLHLVEPSGACTPGAGCLGAGPGETAAAADAPEWRAANAASGHDADHCAICQNLLNPRAAAPAPDGLVVDAVFSCVDRLAVRWRLPDRSGQLLAAAPRGPPRT